MEKPPETLCTVDVTSLSWAMDYHGFLIGTVHFHKTSLFGFETDSYDVGPTDKVEKIGPRARINFIKRELDGFAGAEVVQIHSYESAPEPYELPKHCLVCHSLLTHSKIPLPEPRQFGRRGAGKSGLKCSNTVCESKTTTSLFRLAKVAGIPHGMSTTDVKIYFETFPDQSGVDMGAEDVVTFIPLFLQIGPKANLNRMSCLEKRYSDAGKLFWALEKNLQDKIADGLTLQEFWFVCAIPGLNWDCSIKMHDVSPKSFTSSTVQILRDKAIGEETIKHITQNLERWELYSKHVPLKST